MNFFQRPPHRPRRSPLRVFIQPFVKHQALHQRPHPLWPQINFYHSEHIRLTVTELLRLNYRRGIFNCERLTLIPIYLIPQGIHLDQSAWSAN